MIIREISEVSLNSKKVPSISQGNVAEMTGFGNRGNLRLESWKFIVVIEAKEYHKQERE